MKRYMITFEDFGQDMTHLSVEVKNTLGIIKSVSAFCSPLVVQFFINSGVDMSRLEVGGKFEMSSPYNDSKVFTTRWIIKSIEEVAEKGGEA